MLTREFYRQQAAEQKIAADAATLDNVRERCERAAEAWESLATACDKVDAFRAARNHATAAAE
jgi:hypothetical protein